MKCLSLPLCVLSLWLTGCATNPVTGKSEFQMVSEQQEIAIGRREYSRQIQLSGGPYILDPDLSAYVNRVGQKLANESDRPHLPYEFTIVNDSSWNAWALPGGKIGINRGLLESMRNESELAAVLSHEIVHAAARHSAQQIERGLWMQAGVMGVTLAVDEDLQNTVYETGTLAAGVGMLKYSRDAETEADEYSMKYMKEAGYNPEGAVSLQQLFADNMESAGGWLSSHPASVERVKKNREALRNHKGGYTGAAEYRTRTRELRKKAPAYELYREGGRALKNKNPERALSLSLQARKLVPEESRFYALSAGAYLRMGNTRAALQAMDQAVYRNQEWFYFYLKRAEIHEKSGNRKQAAADYKRSFDLLPTEDAKQGYRRSRI